VVLKELRGELQKLREEKLPNHVLDKLATLADLVSDICPICLQPIEKTEFTMLRTCCHAFCGPCGKQAFPQHKTELQCPVCKKATTSADLTPFLV
jgi:hypothetical protein